MPEEPAWRTVARGGAHAEFSPALGAARARGIGDDVKCGRGGGRHRSWRIARLVRIGRVGPAASAAGEKGGPLLPRARASPSAGLDCGARLRAHRSDRFATQAITAVGPSGVMAAQLIRERDGQRLVNEYPPRRPPLSLAPAPQPPARGLPGTEKLVQRVACFEVIEEVVHGNTNADEYQLSAHDLWIAVKDLIFHDALE